MRRYFNFEINGGDYRQTGTEKVGFVKRADFGDISSRQHTDTDSHIPGGQVSGSCRSSLTVGGKVDEQGIESRKRFRKTESYRLCRSIESDTRSLRAGRS